MIKLSNLIEKKKKKKKNRSVKYRMGGYFYAPFAMGYHSSDFEGGDSGGDMGGGDGGGAVEEGNVLNANDGYSYVIQSDYDIDDSNLNLLDNFTKYVLLSLKIKTPVKIDLVNSREKLKTFAHYDNNNKNIVVYCNGRRVADIARSIAHELVHKKQFEYDEIPKDGVEDIGGKIENEANSKAGILVKKYGYKNSKLYEY